MNPLMQGPTFHQWLNYKTAPTQFNSNKNRPGIDYSNKVCQCGGTMTYGECMAAGVCSKCYYGVPMVTPSETTSLPPMVDTCLVCGTEIPPGPDFCGDECEAKAASGEPAVTPSEPEESSEQERLLAQEWGENEPAVTPSEPTTGDFNAN